MDEATIARWRMRNQLLWHSRTATTAQVLGVLAASQGQDLLPSAWALAQRASAGADLTERDVLGDYDAGAILRTHVLRPTWHFVHPADLRWLLTATAPRVHRINGTVYRKWGFDDGTVATILETVTRALAGGRHRTRSEIGAALGAAGLPLSGQGLAYALMYAELDALVCSGPRRGKQHTYALLDEQVPVRDERSRDEALAELTRRYFTSRGPASVRDLAGWASLTLTEARRATDSVAGEFAAFDLDGVTYWHAPGDPPPPHREARADLLNGLDELVMAYSETRAVLVGGQAEGRDAPEFMYHAILVDGRLAGQWTYRRDGSGRPAQIVIHRLREWTSAERHAVGDAVTRFSRFVEGDVEWA